MFSATKFFFNFIFYYIAINNAYKVFWDFEAKAFTSFKLGDAQVMEKNHGAHVDSLG